MSGCVTLMWSCNKWRGTALFCEIATKNWNKQPTFSWLKMVFYFTIDIVIMLNSVFLFGFQYPALLDTGAACSGKSCVTRKVLRGFLVFLCECSSSVNAPHWFGELSNGLLLTQKVMAGFLALHTGRRASQKHTALMILFMFSFLLMPWSCHFVSGDLPQLRPPLSATVEKESFQQHLVVPHCTSGVS